MEKTIIKNGLLALVIFLFLQGNIYSQEDYTKYVNRFIGTAGNGRVTPHAAVPFGMVQCGPNTYRYGAGYLYDHNSILGFSHVNKSGGGCNDFNDILFVPVTSDRWNSELNIYPEEGFPSRFSHKNELNKPGYYQVQFDNINVELTATSRSAFHRYTFNKNGNQFIAIDLEHGSKTTCTIVEEDSYEKVLSSGLRIVDEYTVEGWRLSSGWAPEQHVYFYAKFSKPIISIDGFIDRKKCKIDSSIQGTDIRAILEFDLSGQNDLLVKVGISPVSVEGARKNLKSEIPDWGFEKIRNNARALWNAELSKFEIQTTNDSQKELFYTSLYNVFLYPMLYSDVDGQFRGPDHLVHKTDGFNYYGGVVGLWDTFRAAVPLTTLTRPDIINEYIQTFLEHYKYFGQLPIWTLAGNETFQMLGIHSIPIITDSYIKGLRNYPVEKVYKAMLTSAMQDTIGYSMRLFVGLINYKKYGYVPADLEYEATARTLEYAYDDWCLAQMAKTLNDKKNYDYFLDRSQNYKNVFDKEKGFMNGRLSDGSFRETLDPFKSSHRQDDFCEGNAWQWTFFVPHDVDGLAQLLGGRIKFAEKLDSLFSVSSEIKGSNVSGDISGLIGQYAHGNEPSHHIPYMYNYAGQPWKTQKITHQILTTLYDNTPQGICGNEDTGQMSAWYAFSSMGLYPMNPASQRYDITSPLFDKIIIKVNDTISFSIIADGLSEENIYIQSAKLNGEALLHPYITYDDILNGGTLEFKMGPDPNFEWGRQESK